MMELTLLLLLLCFGLINALTINCNVECNDFADKNIISFLDYETCMPFDTNESDITPPAPQLVAANWFVDKKTNYIRLNVTFRQHKLQIGDGYFFQIWHSGLTGEKEFCLRINKTELNKLTQSANDSLVYFNYNCYGSDPDWDVTPMDSENKAYMITIYPEPLYAEENENHALEINLPMPDCCDDKYENTINCQEHYYHDCGPLYYYDDVTPSTQLPNNSHKENIYIGAAIGVILVAIILTTFCLFKWKKEKTVLKNCRGHLVLFIVDHDDNKTQADKIVNRLHKKLKLQVKCYWRDAHDMSIVNYLSILEPKCSAIIFLCFGNHENENADRKSVAQRCFENSRNVKVVLACRAGKTKHYCISSDKTFIRTVPHSKLKEKLGAKLGPKPQELADLESETLVKDVAVNLNGTNGAVANGNGNCTNDQLLNSNKTNTTTL